MKRRQFINRIFQALKASVLMNMLWISTSQGESGTKDENRKRFSGMSLRQIANKKLHHGLKRYLSPFGSGVHGNFWRLMRWKLFDESRFKPFYLQEPTVPLKMDWKPIEKYKGLSITFLKHATLVIKDGDDYIYVDPVFFKFFDLSKILPPLTLISKNCRNPSIS